MSVVYLLVALRKESVDRNITGLIRALAPSASLSARRAWIEMQDCGRACAWLQASLSARRAWIEMQYTGNPTAFGSVALRKESVDRN